MSTQIHVYADWRGVKGPRLMGVLNAQQVKARRAFSFTYAREWLNTEEQRLLDPDISWFTGPQYVTNKDNFGMFMDSMPDTWGRTLMRRRENALAKATGTRPRQLHDLDFLLGVHDLCRMGGIRFKTDPQGDFLDNNPEMPAPPWSNIRDLQHAARQVEQDDIKGDAEWLKVLLAAGSSLGGARPKANVIDTNQQMWIAKFPAQHDAIDKAAWEYLAYRLALLAGIEMADSCLEEISGHHRTFFTKRFDRQQQTRVHFASAMTMTSKTEDLLKDEPASYLDMVEFIESHCADVEANLHQLWRRVVFNILISNTDDHLRNHGFLLGADGWRLSPAYDINPSIEKAGMALNIDDQSNVQDLQLAYETGPFYRLETRQMTEIVQQVTEAVSQWQHLAKEISIPRAQQQLMAPAFHIS